MAANGTETHTGRQLGVMYAQVAQGITDTDQAQQTMQFMQTSITNQNFVIMDLLKETREMRKTIELLSKEIATLRQQLAKPNSPARYKIATWNANGLTHHHQEVEAFIKTNQIDILLISEAHFTDRTYFKIAGYVTCKTKHPYGSARGGTAVIIRQNIKHYKLDKFDRDFMQATTIKVEDWNGPITISAAYCPPNYRVSKTGFEEYFKSLGPRFIVGGDYNTKHPLWGSRLYSPRDRALQAVIIEKHLDHFSTGKPNYWPTDAAKIPD